MNTDEVIASIDDEISQLMRVRKLLLTGASFQTRKRKRTLSAAARARISAAQKKRWAQRRKTANR